MKRFITFLLAAAMLLTALPALAAPTEKEKKTFDIFTGESNQILYIEGLNKNVSGLKLTFKNENNTGILSKNKVYSREENGKLWACMVVTPKKTGKCSYEFHYTYTDTNNVFREYFRRITINVSNPPSPPEVTKNPSGETVAEGDSCTFVARAEDAESIMWFLTNGHDTIKASKGPSRFSGLKVSGTDEEKLRLSNIPTSLDGWEAFATFTNEFGSSDSKSADINVYRAMSKITEMPYAPAATPKPAASGRIPTVALSAGPQDPATGAYTLTASLSGCDEYVCQWYYNTTNATAGAIPVGGNEQVLGRSVSIRAGFDGKNAPEYYWFVKVWDALGGTAVYSNCVQLKNPFAGYAQSATPAPVQWQGSQTVSGTGGADASAQPTPYNGTKLCASSVEVMNAAGRAVGLSEQEAEKVTDYLGGTYVLLDDDRSALWYTNAYGTYKAYIGSTPVKTLLPDGRQASGNSVLDEVTKIYAIAWEETPKILTDHTVSASALSVTEQYGFVIDAGLSFGLDGRAQAQPFDKDDHASGWRYSVEEFFDIPIA